MSSTLELKVVFAAIDKFVRPVKQITDAASKASKALKESTNKAQELNNTLAKIDAYEKVTRQTNVANKAFHATKDRIAELTEEISRAGVPTDKQARRLETLSQKQAVLSLQLATLRGHEVDLRTALKLSGVETDKLAVARDHLSSASAAATMNSLQLQKALDAENEKMRRIRAAQAEIGKARATASKMAAAGAGISAAGAAVGLPVAKSLKEFSSFETAMLGVAKQMDGARDDNGKVTQTYWEMADAIKAMSERLPGTANDIAKIVEGGARMGIQGKDNLLKYAEATAIMAQAFDIPVEQIGKDMGTVAQLYKVPIANIKELGDTLNWLDDQTLAQGADIIEVMKRINGVTEMAKMSYKEAAALGTAFLSSGASPEVAATATNAMVRELANATMQSKRFQGGMAMLGLDPKAIQKGMSGNATNTIIMVLEKIKSLAGDKQLEAATRIFGKEYGDDAAKLAVNLDKYRDALKLVNDEKAKGSMDRELSAWQETLAAATENTRDTFNNLATDLGKFMKGEAVDALNKTMSIVSAMREWSAEHPGLSSGIMSVTKWLAIALTGIGLFALAISAVVVPLAVLKVSLVALGLSGSTSFAMIASGIAAMGKAALLSPLGPWIAGIAIAAGALYAAWDVVGPWFGKMLDWISEKLTWIKELLQSIGLFKSWSSYGGTSSPPPLAAPSPISAAGVSNFNVNISTQPGTDNADLGRVFRAEVERLQREQAARNRSRLRDTE